MSTSEPPTWPHCAHGADPAADRVGCRGIHVPGHTTCLAHITGADRDAYLAGLAPGDSIDHRGTTFTRSLLSALLDALRDPTTGRARLGNAEFSSATFEDDAEFQSATFEGGAWFGAATFKNMADFQSVTFEGNAWFGLVTFEGNTGFESVTFEQLAGFQSVTFERHAWFESGTFKGITWFRLATFKGDARFESASFVNADRFGPLVCAGRIVLSGAAFGGPVTLSFAASRVECRRTRWSATAEIRLRYATVDFAHAVFEYPLTIAAEPDLLVLADGSELAETALAGAPGPGVRVASLRGVDAAHLVLADVDLSGCLFTGTVHLDQLR
ncbi:pentapeptide repeat-containing protein, partial [Streptomyces sp. W007]|uniref:pentapeptide repeat-containing protein n=1 Tax=Streptomyces sp. W007 TaxID=1055352 RepID=UPI000516D67E